MLLGDCLLGLYEKALPFSWDWDKKLGAIKELGYDFMEFSVDPAHIDRLNWTEKEIAPLRDASLRLDIPIYTFALSANREYPLGSKDKEVRKEGISLLKKAVAMAQRLGVRVIQVAAYDVFDKTGEAGWEGDAETDRLFLESLKECERCASLGGVMLALETMDAPYADSVKKCKRLVDAIGSPWVQIYADTGNIASAGFDFKKEIQYGASNIIAVHLKDSIEGVVRGIDYGTGLVDFHEDLAALKKIGFRGLFVAEMWWKDSPGYYDSVGAACRFLRRVIKEVDET